MAPSPAQSPSGGPSVDARGWAGERVLRITTRAANVLNTDWVSDGNL